MPDNQPEASSAPAVRESVRFSRDGEALPPYNPGNPENQKLAGQAKQLPHELYAARVAVVAALKTEGYTRKQIAAALGMTLSGVHWCVRKAREQKILQTGMAETLALIEDEALPLAVEGLLRDLRRGNQEAYLATLRGRGILRNFNNNKNEGNGGGAPMAFQFNFVMPGGETVNQPKVPALPGQVFGSERGDDE